jgi:long-chain acyl-CoA synthetase
MIPYIELQKATEKWGKRTLFITDQHTEVSFEALMERTEKLAGALEKKGITKGDVIAVLLPNCVELVELYLAGGALGAIFQPLDIRFRGEELRNTLAYANAKIVVAHGVNAKDVEAAIPGSLLKLLVHGKREGFRPYEQFLENGRTPKYLAKVDEDIDNAVYLFSSGSSGVIKCIPMTYGQLDYFATDVVNVMGMAPDDRGISLLPFSHISGPVVVNLCLVSGCSCVVTQKWKPVAIVDCFEKYRVSWAHTVPPLGDMILKGNPAAHDLSAVRFIGLMGTAIPVDMLVSLEEAIPTCRAIQGYGLTETSPMLTLLPLEYHKTKRGSIGIALENAEIKVVDDSGRDVDSGETGELIARGPKIFKGYLGKPELTAKVIRDGWFHTGDVVKFDDEGFFFHLGRKDDVINCGGLMVYPAEVEGVLIKHPMVEDTVVYGVGDQKRGNKVVAEVVLGKGAELSAPELRRFLRQDLAHYKVPTRIDIVKAITRTPTGKPIRGSNDSEG